MVCAAREQPSGIGGARQRGVVHRYQDAVLRALQIKLDQICAACDSVAHCREGVLRGIGAGPSVCHIDDGGRSQDRGAVVASGHGQSHE
jgi:hypothetical protein